jgi:hypothetical protein
MNANPISPSEMACILHRTIRAAISPEAVGKEPAQALTDLRMPGELEVRAPATGQRFRVTVALIDEDSS